MTLSHFCHLSVEAEVSKQLTPLLVGLYHLVPHTLSFLVRVHVILYRRYLVTADQKRQQYSRTAAIIYNLSGMTVTLEEIARVMHCIFLLTEVLQQQAPLKIYSG